MDDLLKNLETKKKESFFDKIISSSLLLFFSKKMRIQRYLFGLLIVGFILRLIASLNLTVLADDMIEASQSAGIIGAKMLSTSSHPALYFYLTDFTYRLIGYSTLASRFWPLLTGTLTILLVFLITEKLFGNKNIALLSAFFVTFSAFLIRNTFAEMSNMWLFFVFLGTYLGLLYFDYRKPYFIIFSAIAFGLGLLTKYNAPFFILSFLLFSIVYLKNKNRKIFTRTNIYYLALFLFIIFIFALPPLTFNYLLYKDKGIVDIYFSRIIQTEATQNLYGSLSGQGTSFFGNLINPISYSQFNLPYHTDLVILLFALIGFTILLYRKKYLQMAFILIFLIIPFVLQSAGSYLAKHFVFIPFVLSIVAGFGLYELIKKLKNKNLVYALLVILTLFMLFNLGNAYSTPNYFLDKSPTSQLKSYIGENVNENDLIIYDPRIYTSRSFWIGTPYHIIDVPRFVEFFNKNQEIPLSMKIPVDIYLIECAIDDCGWGTIKNQPELNQSLEVFFAQFPSENTVKQIYGIEYDNNEFINKNQGPLVYKVYKQTVLLNPGAVAQLDSINSFYFTPYLYKDLSNYIYKYEIHSLPDRLLEDVAYFVIILSMVLTILSFILVIYLILNLIQ